MYAFRLCLYKETSHKIARSTLCSVREFCYYVALVGFVSAAGEEMTHLLYVQVGAPVGYGLWVGLFVVILLAQCSGMLFVIFVWANMYNEKSCTAFPFWIAVEVTVAFCLLLFFGSGFIIGPLFIILSSFVRVMDTFIK